MPQYKLKEGKLVRRNSKGEKETLVAGDKVELTKDQARTFGLNLLELQHADEESEGEGSEKKEGGQDPQLTVNPNPDGAKQPAKKQPAKKA